MQVFMMTPRSYKCCGQFVSVVRLPAKDFSDWRFVAAVLLLLLQLLLLLLKDSCSSWKFVTHAFLRYRDVSDHDGVRSFRVSDGMAQRSIRSVFFS